MKARSLACRAGIVLLGVLALLSCSAAVLDQANEEPAEVAGAPAGAPESAPEPETPDTTPTANPPSAVEPAAPDPPRPPKQPPPGVHGCASCNLGDQGQTDPGPTVTVAESTVTFTTYVSMPGHVNPQRTEVTRKAFRFTRTGDDLTQRLVITFANSSGGSDWTVITGFSPGKATLDYPSVGITPGVHMDLELRPSTDLQAYINLGKGPEDGFRPYQLGDPSSLVITGS